MIYVLLSIAVLAILALATVPVLTRLPHRPLVLTALVLVALTAVFDNVIIGLGIVDYDPARISGLRLGVAPVEDFAYTIAAVLLVPTLWTLFAPRTRDAAAPDATAPDAAAPDATTPAVRDSEDRS
ncbi:lycopene cyclase domain-containing protein [Demequina pelophila]|uniref:lycopene cyclase domain-containing protein n=1 Tax=Demequina pelophila TaxID=1638984 RepID=UPI000785010D|nr:lycopene cyclase domain-containing protein [Demequina pelophila]